MTRPHLLRSSYLSLFLFFFGSGGRSAGFSTRAVEHSTTPKEALHHSVQHMGPPVLSADPSMPQAQSVKSAIVVDGVHSTRIAPPIEQQMRDALQRQEGLTVGAGENAAYRHTSRLSVVQDGDEEATSAEEKASD